MMVLCFFMRPALGTPPYPIKGENNESQSPLDGFRPL